MTVCMLVSLNVALICTLRVSLITSLATTSMYFVNSQTTWLFIWGFSSAHQYHSQVFTRVGLATSIMRKFSTSLSRSSFFQRPVSQHYTHDWLGCMINVQRSQEYSQTVNSIHPINFKEVSYLVAFLGYYVTSIPLRGLLKCFHTR